MAKVGIIGGSGLYNIEGLESVKKIKVDTPFGEPSGMFITGTLDGKEVVFLPRHDEGHTILPSELNYRANIYGMKKLGVDAIISISAVGSLKEELKPLDIVVIDQFVDRTNQARNTTFFGDGIVGHVAFAQPICPDLAKKLYDSGCQLNVRMHNGGTYVNMEGPMFSTMAESNLYRSWGMDVIGMTNMPEARLSREAGICYATLAMVTDYDCWHQSEEEVTIEMIIKNLSKNADNARKIVKKVVAKITDKKCCGCEDAARYAIVTRKDKIPQKKKRDLDIIIGKYL
ncbi:MAG: S-methyl-5'-thioadenosine phosphorylase [Candidatus Omnitrophota bacterium]